MTLTKDTPDGRKLRWIDCDWNEIDGGNACTVCRVCKYLDFLDYSHGCAPAGSVVERDRKLDEYLKVDFKTTSERVKYLMNL